MIGVLLFLLIVLLVIIILWMIGPVIILLLMLAVTYFQDAAARAPAHSSPPQSYATADIVAGGVIAILSLAVMGWHEHRKEKQRWQRLYQKGGNKCVKS